MDESSSCQSCDQKDSCEQAYCVLGRKEGSSIVARVSIAFLLPLLVFIGVLAISQKIIGKYVEAQYWQTTIGFVFALAVTGVCVVSTKLVRMRLHRHEKSRCC